MHCQARELRMTVVLYEDKSIGKSSLCTRDGMWKPARATERFYQALRLKRCGLWFATELKKAGQCQNHPPLPTAFRPTSLTIRCSRVSTCHGSFLLVTSSYVAPGSFRFTNAHHIVTIADLSSRRPDFHTPSFTLTSASVTSSVIPWLKVQQGDSC
jgi:hypothetical protein